MADSMDWCNETFYEDISSLESDSKCELLDDLPVVDDEKILALVRDFQHSGGLTPFIKEELKFKIKQRRLESGLDELVLTDSRKSSQELSSADMNRRELRKEQNRRAAQRYRVKQRAKASVVKKEMDQLESDNVQLMGEIKKLHREKDELFRMLQSHLKECVLGQYSEGGSGEPWQITTSSQPCWSQFTETLSNSSQ